MRPVERGAPPTKADGTPKNYSSYGTARADLIERMGQYCSYCNQKLPASLAVEHVRPKILDPALTLEWDNFLLGCTNCNSSKGDTPVTLDQYLWPDLHNTHLAFDYTADGKVNVKAGLAAETTKKAQNLLKLVGLQKYPRTATASDRRWLNRKDAFTKADAAMRLYLSAASKGAAPEFEEALGLWASDNGFFSIWMSVFDAYPGAKRRIAEAFTGTAPNSLNADFTFRNRTAEL